MQEILQGTEAQLLVVYGRRRAGKTFLIKNFFQQQVFFEYTGIHKGTLNQQLEAFTEANHIFKKQIADRRSSHLDAHFEIIQS